MKYWEIIADRLHAEGWSYGIAEHLTKHGLLFCVDAHRDGKRFIVRADDLLTAFLSLERDAIAPKGAAMPKGHNPGFQKIKLDISERWRTAVGRKNLNRAEGGCSSR